MCIAHIRFPCSSGFCIHRECLEQTPLWIQGNVCISLTSTKQSSRYSCKAYVHDTITLLWQNSILTRNKSIWKTNDFFKVKQKVEMQGIIFSSSRTVRECLLNEKECLRSCLLGPKTFVLLFQWILDTQGLSEHFYSTSSTSPKHSLLGIHSVYRIAS